MPQSNYGFVFVEGKKKIKVLVYDVCVRRGTFFCVCLETSPLSIELPEDYDQFRFLHTVSLNHLKGVCWFDRDQRLEGLSLFPPTGSKESDKGSKDQGTYKWYPYVVKVNTFYSNPFREHSRV